MIVLSVCAYNDANSSCHAILERFSACLSEAGIRMEWLIYIR